VSDDRFNRGLRTQAQFDPEISAELQKQLADIAPDFAKLTIAVAFGDIASRPGLPRVAAGQFLRAPTVARGCPGSRYASSSQSSEYRLATARQVRCFRAWARARSSLP
jgi:hypothetical protein